MHAVYHFLVNVDLSQPEEAIKSDVMATFNSYADNHCDENNWWAEIDIVTADNRVLDLEGGARWHATDNSSFEYAKLHALRCVANDMNLFETSGFSIGGQDEGGKKIDSLDFDGLLQAIKTEVPRTLAEGYGKLAEGVVDSDWISHYRRKKLGDHFERLMESRDGKVPFVDPASPYQYRCFDLTGYEQEGNAILRVDIHT